MKKDRSKIRELVGNLRGRLALELKRSHGSPIRRGMKRLFGLPGGSFGAACSGSYDPGCSEQNPFGWQSCATSTEAFDLNELGYYDCSHEEGFYLAQTCADIGPGGEIMCVAEFSCPGFFVCMTHFLCAGTFGGCEQEVGGCAAMFTMCEDGTCPRAGAPPVFQCHRNFSCTAEPSPSGQLFGCPPDGIFACIGEGSKYLCNRTYGCAGIPPQYEFNCRATQFQCADYHDCENFFACSAMVLCGDSRGQPGDHFGCETPNQFGECEPYPSGPFMCWSFTIGPGP